MSENIEDTINELGRILNSRKIGRYEKHSIPSNQYSVPDEEEEVPIYIYAYPNNERREAYKKLKGLVKHHINTENINGGVKLSHLAEQKCTA